ncbi:L-2-amino-thiazoline-4-carboxylic acid hydrolase [Shimia aestuarii]|uniref:L-2-amino-thiazoline-4-carboxylic acid hydrolase n=1 Tax=Shimia aestuarii TaxID=254406 RepID=UPI001FB53B74|nr:L-2-amino-thiazoline-4-carboxylic acid hydrolase [Shimia aestuarii]
MLLWFPFNAPGAPGYEVRATREGDDILTHFTHCPPQSFARRLSEEINDPKVLEVFRRSWCTYDWLGADLIAGDGCRGHYRRKQTLSHGDPVCDMCWAARVDQSAQPGEKAGHPRKP